jgi:hypothetical protein
MRDGVGRLTECRAIHVWSVPEFREMEEREGNAAGFVEQPAVLERERRITVRLSTRRQELKD